MQDDESRPEQTSRVTAVNLSNWRRTAIAVVIIATVTGASGYLLGIGTNKNASPSTQRVSFQPSPTIIPSSTLVLSISPLPATEAVSWKTYTDTDYGYQANYPQEFTSRQMGVNILFGSKSVGISMYRLISKNANPNRETVDIPWFGNYLAGSYGSYLKSVGSFPKLILEEIVIDGKRAVKVTEQLVPPVDDLYIKIFIPHDRDILEIHFNIAGNLSRHPDVINNFISTFIATFRFSD